MMSLLTLPNGQEHIEEGAASDEDNEDNERKEEGTGEYEFSPWEERVLQVVMDALRMAALALGLQALSSVLLGVALAGSATSAHCPLLDVDCAARAGPA